MAFLNAVLLLGLAAALIPPVVHLFNRRRADPVDWAAMQFLRLVPAARRRVAWEHVLLMLLRSAALALLAVALAAPTVDASLTDRLAPPADRDVVFVLDGSASMAYRVPEPAADRARQWTANALGRLGAGDRVAVLQARQRPVAVAPDLTTDRGQAANALELLAAPAGTADWPAALQAALKLLEGGRANQHVVIVTDGQRHGWADEATLARWELLRKTIDRGGAAAPRVWVVNVAADRPAEPANRSLDPITSGRGVAVAGREAAFRSAVRSVNVGSPPRVRLEVDGRTVRELKPDASGGLRFAYKFPAGSHVVTLRLDPDDLPADDRQDFVLEVLPAIPVLLVRINESSSVPRSAFRVPRFLQDALSPPRDPTPAFRVRTITADEFRPGVLTQDVNGPGTPPRVVVLADLPRLTTEQQTMVEGYLAHGGSVLVTLGEHCDPAAWDRVAFRGGQGFLPARVVEVVEGESRPDPASFTHPAAAVFREPLPGGLHTAVFPRRWRLDPTGVNGPTGTPVARLTTGEPLLVERGFGTGRVIVSAVPLDDSWGTNLPRLPDFVRLAHELVYYLAGARGADRNLDAAQPIVFTPNPYEPPGPVAVLGPDGRSLSVATTGWPAVIDGPHDPGAYRLTTPTGRTQYYAVRPDPREAVLTSCSEEDMRKVANVVGRLVSISSIDDIRDDPGTAGGREVWWVLMLAVVGLLGAEVWYTRQLSARTDSPLPPSSP
ncbi:MAG TPA: VWA domain-containing protein [Fimbriiglobus sp.]|nr:VWA domain-containing protein [Fimbriiglobus sp.]